MKLRKRNYKKRKYEPYEIPKTATPILWLNRMDVKIGCNNCGKIITFAKSYTSLTIHNYQGLGYPVCPECYNEERKQRKKYEKD